MKSLIEIKQLDKNFGTKKILKNIDFTINQGEIFGLLGPSGSGKTTLVKMISGIETSTSGEVKVLNTVMPNRLVAKDIGYMGQSDALYEDLTGIENIMFFASLHKIRGHHAKKRCEELLDILDLKDAKHKKVSHYSGGMKKRLSLIIAIFHQPKILILDEPTVGIDPVLRRSVWEQFYHMRNQGTTLLVTTHIMEEIEKCDRAALIQNGEIVEMGTISELKEKTDTKKIEELFFKKGEYQQ